MNSNIATFPTTRSQMGEATIKLALQQYVSRIENLENEKADLASDIRDIYAEAVGNGFDKKTIREVIKLRKLDKAAREEKQQMVQLYLDVLGG